MTQPVVTELIALLKLERLEENLFRGQSRDIGTKYVFGGQVLGQALSAAQQTVDAVRKVHSLHAYFLRAGDINAPIIYDVDRDRRLHDRDPSGSSGWSPLFVDSHGGLACEGIAVASRADPPKVEVDMRRAGRAGGSSPASQQSRPRAL